MEAQPRRTNGAQPGDAMARIERRLERIEAMLARVEDLAEPLPGLAAMAADSLDEMAETYGQPDARLREATSLVERLTRPDTLRMLRQAVDVAETLPGMVAMAVDAMDEVARQAAAQGVDVETYLAQLLETAQGLTRLATSEEVRAMLDSDMLNQGAITALSSAARALSTARMDGGPERVGLFGAVGALRDPDVQRAVAFALRFARNFGQTCDAINGTKQLAAG